jgi:hypothetical protein
MMIEKTFNKYVAEIDPFAFDSGKFAALRVIARILN